MVCACGCISDGYIHPTVETDERAGMGPTETTGVNGGGCNIPVCETEVAGDITGV